MLEPVTAVLQNFWLVPIVIILLFIWVEEHARKARYQDEIRHIETVKLKHEKMHSQGKMCETTLKNIVENNHNDEALRLYYIDFPIVQRCMASLHVRKYSLYLALAIVLLLLQYLLSRISGGVITTDQTHQIESALSAFGLLSCIGFGLYLWFRRFIPIRTFCDKIKKLKEE